MIRARPSALPFMEGAADLEACALWENPLVSKGSS